MEFLQKYSTGILAGLLVCLLLFLLWLFMRYRAKEEVRRSMRKRMTTNIEVLKQGINEFMSRPRYIHMAARFWEPEVFVFHARVYWQHDLRRRSITDSVVRDIVIDLTTGEIFLDGSQEAYEFARADSPPTTWKDFVADILHQLELYQPVQRVG